MQSSGALVAAEKMRAKDAVLSGPAGGAVATAAAGAARAVGFDMGGTSTDVCCCDGGFARQIENEIGGARLFAPMIAIHTIAAGGGSLARVVDGRLAVGPAIRRRPPRPRGLWRRRPGDDNRLQCRFGKIAGAVFSFDFRDARRFGSRRKSGRNRARQNRPRSAARRAPRFARARRFVRRRRGRKYGGRDSQNHRRARARRAPFFVELLRRRGRATRLPSRRRARYRSRARPAPRRGAFGVGNRNRQTRRARPPNRRSRSRARGRGSENPPRRRRARSPLAARIRRRSRKPRRRRARALPLRRIAIGAGGRLGGGGRDARRFRSRPQKALRIFAAEQSRRRRVRRSRNRSAATAAARAPFATAARRGLRARSCRFFAAASGAIARFTIGAKSPRGKSSKARPSSLIRCTRL